MKKLIVIISFFVFLGTVHIKAQSPSDTLALKKVEVRVDGLSCPFCAYGLEKKAMGIAGVDSVKIDVEKALMTLTVKDGKVIAEDDIRKQVKKAGFTPGEISYPDPD